MDAALLVLEASSCCREEDTVVENAWLGTEARLLGIAMLVGSFSCEDKLVLDAVWLENAAGMLDGATLVESPCCEENPELGII